jgi:hypothetical protein
MADVRVPWRTGPLGRITCDAAIVKRAAVVTASDTKTAKTAWITVDSVRAARRTAGEYSLSVVEEAVTEDCSYA